MIVNGAVLLLAMALQPDANAAEKEARESVLKAAAELKKLDSAAYSITWHLPRSSTRFEAGVRLRKPNQLRLEGAFKAAGRNDPALYVFDGKEESCIDFNEGRYFKRPQVINRSYSTWEDAIRLFYFDGPFTAWMEFATDLRKLNESGSEFPTVVEWSIRYTGDVRWRLHLDEKSMVRRLEKFVGGICFLRVEYGKIEPNPRLADDLFRFTPPEGAKLRRGLGEYEEKLIAVGAEAPGFDCLDSESQPVNTSAWKGKPVLFITWSFP